LTTLSTLFTFFFTMIPQQPRSTLFPYTTLFRSSCVGKSTKEIKKRSEIPEELTWKLEDIFATDEQWEEEFKQLQTDIPKIGEFQDRKSTRLNSSHVSISYAVFCLKKKKRSTEQQ